MTLAVKDTRYQKLRTRRMPREDETKAILRETREYVQSRLESMEKIGATGEAKIRVRDLLARIDSVLGTGCTQFSIDRS